METTYIAIGKKTLALGFIGVGWIGRNRMQAILDNGKAKAAAIAEPGEENAAEALKMAPDAAMVAPEDIYNNGDLDGVVIATPSALHAEQSLNALEAGKAVFCQKPLGRTAAEVEAIIEASQHADKLLSVDLSYRYTKAFNEVFEVITSGQIGKVYAVNLVFHNAYGPDKAWFYDIKQSGGGCVMDLGVHLLDMAMCCLGFPEIDEVKSTLYSKGEKLLPREEKVEDYAKAVLGTAEGTTISLDCSWNISAGKDAVIEAVFYGTEAGAAFRNVNGSFYDFVAEKYNGTQVQILENGIDKWCGRAGAVWASNVLKGKGFDPVTANEYLAVAKLIDRLYGR
ncbi:Gfo/Idh/MocA family oxidoreductase [Flavobacterium sp. J372]|uniref:Gfo/Idh/MocA family protein n=1 Tax=Flavobacterium sp. J372 TaxID=2898436 RepID=UPI002151971F|nr:Gfo/Idh/MocA family oxidoreductase [Flavobacterium sp. J372]MCR5862039.1 Gfo/Idh/MocA family oxidoreductase [Flavobacterium sp. J372]